MALWRLYYHLIWATHERIPLITAEIENHLYGYIICKADALGCITHAIGGIEDHIHTVTSIPPKLSISEFVKNIKGSSSYHINHSVTSLESQFVWQRGYGIFSFGGKNIERIVDYVLNQKDHHKEGRIISSLEKMNEEDVGPELWNNGKALAGIAPK